MLFVSRKYRLHHKPTQLHTNIPYPSVSIIKPLLGVDPHLLTNLETFFTMNYPKVRSFSFSQTLIILILY